MKTWLIVILMIVVTVGEIYRIYLGIPELTAMFRISQITSLILVASNYIAVIMGVIAERRRK